MLKDLIAQILTDSGTLAPPIKVQIDYKCKIVESPTKIKMRVNLSPMDIIDLMQKDSIQVESITIGNKEFITPTGDINKNNQIKEREVSP